MIEPNNDELSSLPKTSLKYIEWLESEISAKNTRIYHLLQEQGIS